jgi:hypothetical protein
MDAMFVWQIEPSRSKEPTETTYLLSAEDFVFTLDYTHKLLPKGSLEHRASSFRKKCDFSDQEALEGQATSKPKTPTI